MINPIILVLLKVSLKNIQDRIRLNGMWSCNISEIDATLFVYSNAKNKNIKCPTTKDIEDKNINIKSFLHTFFKNGDNTIAVVNRR